MKLAIMQPYFFPYIGYYQLIKAVDKFVIYDDVNFIKRGWVNRNRILLNGEPKMINLQLNNASQNKYINVLEISGDENYRHKLLKTIHSCYRKAPFYHKAYPVIEDIITYSERNLAAYLEKSIRQVCSYLSINTEILLSSSINKDNSLHGQDKIIDICSIMGADTYINAIGGQELYSYEAFAANNMELCFLKPKIREYKQYKNEFVPGLSIIDIMMFNSIEDIDMMLAGFELKGR